MGKLLQMIGINKSFFNVKVLDNVYFELETGEVHALLGENGAGKSTLIKILGGNYTKDSGQILVNDTPVEIHRVEDARANGIRIIHQELMMVPDLNIAENIFLGQEKVKKFNLVDKNKQMEEAQVKLNAFGMMIPASTLLRNLTIAQQQMIEIIRAISFGARIIVMDEPTSSLSEEEVKVLFEIVRKLKSEGIGIIYISHRLSELFEIADRVTVLRDGMYVATKTVKDTTKDELVSLMVGRSISQYYTKTNTATDATVMYVEDLGDNETVKSVSFDLKRGEILGFAGLVGSGRSETMQLLFGLRKRARGAVKILGKNVDFINPSEAIKNGLGLVPEDRKTLGNFPDQGVRFNSTITVLKEFLRHGNYNAKKEKELTQKYINFMNTKVNSMEQVISSLSGGNQQKVLISRWLLATQKILILDEPTRGVDIGTKAEIYRIMDELAANGMAIIMVSSELPELINMCDRIVVMSHGISTGIVERNEFSQEKIMSLATHEIEKNVGGRAYAAE